MSAFNGLVPWQPCEKTGWPVVQVKHMFETVLGKMLQPQPASDDDIEAPYTKSLHVQRCGVSFEDLPTMWASPTDVAQLHLQVGDLMVCEGGEVGRGALVLADPPPLCIFQNALHRVRARDLNDVRYLNYCLKQASEAGWLDVLCNRATIAHFTVEKFREFRIHLPSGETQRLIANYLDHETTRIDGLIAEKERMLALLEEKRTALISRVVTRGLDPNAPLKHSGQEWLGDIPAHWKIQPIKYLAIVGNGSTPSVENTDYWDDESYPWLNSSVVNVSPVTNASRFVTETALRECHLPKIRPPAVLLGITGQGKTRGMAAVLGIEATINQHLAFIKPRTQELDSDFLCYLLGHAYAFLRSDSDGAGSTKGAITCEQLATMKIPVPPGLEQFKICNRIRSLFDISKPLHTLIQRSLDLLIERRAALITAAVTGQIPLEEMTP
ncbi:MAG TPA: restriction endonuclease subunit S [Candidatus Competibacter sp.]|nr:restriction endonuclease subunit S [Candidatus Competibacter sp.]